MNLGVEVLNKISKMLIHLKAILRAIKGNKNISQKPTNVFHEYFVNDTTIGAILRY